MNNIYYIYALIYYKSRDQFQLIREISLTDIRMVE